MLSTGFFSHGHFTILEFKHVTLEMVNVWLAEPGATVVSRPFTLEKSVKEILDDFVSDPTKRSKSYLVFLGKALEEDMRLCDVKDMKDSYTLQVMIRSKADPIPKLQLNNKKLQECREKFQFLRASRRSREKVVDIMSKEDFMEGLLKEFPLLKRDRQAQIVAKDFLLSSAYIMGKQHKEEEFLQEHPILVDVVHYWLRSINVPSKMSHSDSNASISDHVMPASVHANNAPIITPQMLQEAMAQAMQNVGVGNNSQGNSSFNSSSQQLPGTLPAPGFTRYASQMAQLVDFGFTDTEQNGRLLEETGGNVEQALELLIALRESVMDLGDTQNG